MASNLALAPLPDEKSQPGPLDDTKVDTNSSKEEAPLEPLAQTRKQLLTERIQFATLCWSIIVTGWNDGSTGPLIPRLQVVYGIGYATVSLLFICATIGFITGAFLNVPFSDKFTFGQLMVLGAFLQAIAYAISSAALPFPVLCVAYAINGIGMALQDGQANGYIATLKRKPEKKMGILHAAYGAGAMLSPLAATQFSRMTRWSFHYLVSLSLALSNTALLIVVFRLKSGDDCLVDVGQEATEKQKSSESSLRQILYLKSVHLLSLYILVYVGVESTIGGWIVTYILREKHGNSSTGYIASGYYGGIMIGRVALLKVNEKVGEHRVLFYYFVIALGLEFIIWFVPSLIGGAIAAAFLGLVLAPWYPVAMNEAARILPQWLLAGSMGWIAGFGQAGSALFPFITGAISQRTSIRSFPPITVAMTAFTIVIWAVVLQISKQSMARRL
ncbi:major facilitator superfamily domain-containing protein [Collybia nuda]|uniref:Major facilitator superfamily domain-containing protein n=1 Tax=Collybia nuda TaxID=64659 RepID=A0A9P6CA69_9AGAR|nr:major facilitator superfamily domain-containing protein [Collybia nuda]